MTIALVVGLLMFLVARFAGKCVIFDASDASQDYVKAPFYCRESETNDLATLFFSEQDSAVRYLFNKNEATGPGNHLNVKEDDVCTNCYYFFSF